MDWTLAEAKEKLSEVTRRAATQGPQTIRLDRGAVVVVAESMYRALTGERPTFKDWLLNAPRTDDLERPARGDSPARGADVSDKNS